MILIYKFFVKILDFIVNIIFAIQIFLMVTIFLTSLYWLFNLINIGLFNFAEPFASWIYNLVILTYKKEVILSGTNVDGTILFFDVIALIFTFIITIIKSYIYKLIEFFEYNLVVKRKQVEQKMNEELEEDSVNFIKKYKKAAIVIEFHAKNNEVDKFWGGDPNEGVKEHITEAVSSFYSDVKSLSGCSFIRTSDKIVVLVNNFEKIDRIVRCIQDILQQIIKNMANNNWEIYTYSAIDVFFDTMDFKSDVYPVMRKLLELQQKNEIICYGNFSLRYNLLPKPMYYLIVLKGAYTMGKGFGNHNIYTMVKKH